MHLIHDTKLVPAENGLDMVLMAAFEGIELLWFDENESKWEHHVVGTGLPPDQAFHGNVVSVYIKNSQGVKGPECLKQDVWTRIQVDSFGPLDDQTHTGTIPSVYAVKIGGREFEAFGIACIGAPENQGVYVYSPTNFALEHFSQTEILDQSAGQLAVAAFAEKNRLASSNMCLIFGSCSFSPSLCKTSLRFLTPLLLLPAVTPQAFASTESLARIGKYVILICTKTNFSI
ncbi:hypothetical protein C8J56DRAFT_1124907 [Mycena floridula]|nr:hypothetical protein C8J56DRAFT_1124907 [Mycena floridula]